MPGVEVAKQPYYRWLANPVTQREWEDAQLIDAAIDIPIDDPAFGYRFIADELAEAGFTASERRAWRLCSQMGIISAFVRKKSGARIAWSALRSETISCSASSPPIAPTGFG